MDGERKEKRRRKEEPLVVDERKKKKKKTGEKAMVAAERKKKKGRGTAMVVGKQKKKKKKKRIKKKRMKGRRRTWRESRRLTKILIGGVDGDRRSFNHQASSCRSWCPDGWRTEFASWRLKGELEDDRRLTKYIDGSFKGGGGGGFRWEEMEVKSEEERLGFGGAGERKARKNVREAIFYWEIDGGLIWAS